MVATQSTLERCFFVVPLPVAQVIPTLSCKAEQVLKNPMLVDPFYLKAMLLVTPAQLKTRMLVSYIQSAVAIESLKAVPKLVVLLFVLRRAYRLLLTFVFSCCSRKAHLFNSQCRATQNSNLNQQRRNEEFLIL